jgi:hypothetical protein
MNSIPILVLGAGELGMPVLRNLGKGESEMIFMPAFDSAKWKGKVRLRPGRVRLRPNRGIPSGLA